MVRAVLCLVVVKYNATARADISNYIPQYLWDVITCPCPWYMLLVMPLFHWPTMTLRSYGVRKSEQIRSKIAEMVWWNISGATISHVLRFNCVSMANGWRTCGAYGAWTAMPLRMMSRMRTWQLRIHGASGVCIAYIPRTRGDQLDSTAYGGRMYSAWAEYMPNLQIDLILFLWKR